MDDYWSESEDSFQVENDWYNESDTSEDIPDPNLQPEALYQERDKLPTVLQSLHFVEGLICTMTLKKKNKSPMLILIVELLQKDFLYRVFFYQKSSAKTWHHGADDKLTSYDSVWRLAPREEYYRVESPHNTRMGQTIWFSYGMDERMRLAFVMGITSSRLKCRLECGKRRGNVEIFEQDEIIGCKEVFTSSAIQDIFNQTKISDWQESPRSITKEFRMLQPQLKFFVPPEEKHKRRWHVNMILGEAIELLCSRTNAHARRKFANCLSDAYKRRWKDLLPGGRMDIFLGVHIGVSILHVGPRHLMKRQPTWLSQLGYNKLFEKLTTDLYRL